MEEVAPWGRVARTAVRRPVVAGATLGDPEVLIFDEPVNGLDPDGVRWVRELVRSLAAEGRTVFLSSHLMSEMQLTADQLVTIGKGKLQPGLAPRIAHAARRLGLCRRRILPGVLR